MNDMQTLKLLVLHLLRERALITGCRVDRSSQLNVNALTVQRGTTVPNRLQDATAVHLEIRTLDALTVSNDAASDLDLDLAVAFLMRVIGAGGERAERLRRMFAPHMNAGIRVSKYGGRLLAGGETDLDVEVIDVDSEDK